MKIRLSEVNKQILDAIVISSNTENAGKAGNLAIFKKEDTSNYSYTSTKCTLFFPVEYDDRIGKYVENEHTITSEDDDKIYVESKNGYVNWEFEKNDEGKVVKFTLKTKPMLTYKIRNAKDDELNFGEVIEELATIQDSYEGMLKIYNIITGLEF